jgi:hypothetical protein
MKYETTKKNRKHAKKQKPSKMYNINFLPYFQTQYIIQPVHTRFQKHASFVPFLLSPASSPSEMQCKLFSLYSCCLADRFAFKITPFGSALQSVNEILPIKMMTTD